MRKSDALTRVDASVCHAPNPKAETTNHHFACATNTVSVASEMMPETFEKAPNNHPGVQSRICLPTPP